jgi:hypothetical protein
MEGDTTIIKLLSHHFREDGRTLVRLSGVNCLWRTLLRRDPDGALYVFCKRAFFRLPFDAIIFDQDFIGVFLFYAQMYLYGEYTALMFKTLILHSIKNDSARISISKKMQISSPRVLGNLLMKIVWKMGGWRMSVVEIEVASFVIQQHYYKWLWDGHLERSIWWNEKFDQLAK